MTANRWARLLRSVGHRVEIAETFTDQPCGVLIALHARKSAASVQRFSRARPHAPIILALTGTDLYRDLPASKPALRSLELATRLLLLQPQSRRELPRHLQPKARVIFQSAERLKNPPRPLQRIFEVCVSGHLRPVKDPFRAAMAARGLPAESRIAITHIGGALSASMEQRALKEMQRNARYRWLGEVPLWKARRITARSRLLVLSSRMEGGPSVISEALVASVPVLSTRISGSIGLLGEDYQGYFDVGNTAQLAELLARCEQDTAFYRVLRESCRRRAGLFAPEAERAAWESLIREVV